MNDIAEVEFECNLPLFFEPYAVNRALGSFILIDPFSNATVGAAMIVAAASGETEELANAPLAVPPSLILLPGAAEDAAAIREAFAARGFRVVSLDDPGISPGSLPSVLRALQLAGVVAVTSRTDILDSALDAVRSSASFLIIESVEEAQACLRKEKGPVQ